MKGPKKLSIAFFKSKSMTKCALLLAFNDTDKAAWLFLRGNSSQQNFNLALNIFSAKFGKTLHAEKKKETKLVKSILNGNKE